MNADTTPARLPLVGEAARPPQRGVLAAGQTTADGRQEAPETAPEAAPIIALHGVGEFAHGDVIGEIARHPVYSRSGNFRRETVFAREYRFTALMEAGGGADKRHTTRLLEINWSDVRRAMPNLVGLLRTSDQLISSRRVVWRWSALPPAWSNAVKRYSRANTVSRRKLPLRE